VPAGFAYRHPSPTAHAVRRCPACGLRGVARPEDLAGSEARYAGHYYAQTCERPALRTRLKAVLEASDHPASAWVRARLFTACLPKPSRPGSVMLDVGCGGGQLLDRARALGWTAEGCELSDATAQAARSKGFAVFTDEWHQKLSADRYDLVMMSNVLEHLHTPGPALNAIARALRRDGVTLITLPNFGSAQAKTFGGRWWALLPPEHVWYYRLDHVTAVLRAAGIEVRAVRTQSVVTGVLAPSTVRLQWRTWRLGGGSIPRFCRLFVHGLAVPPGIGPDSVTVARSPLYTLECVRAPRA